MTPDDIKDYDSLQAWLARMPAGTRLPEAIALAWRAALRVLPHWSGRMDAAWARKSRLTSLPVLRQLLTSGVVGTTSTPEVRATVIAAASGAAAAAGNADDADDADFEAVQAVDAAYAASFVKEDHDAADTVFRAAIVSSSSASIWDHVRNDARLIEAGGDPFVAPLWAGPKPDWFRALDAKTRAIWQRQNPDHWAFWVRWWDGVLTGQPLDWKLQQVVALIPDEIWRAGPGTVADAIKEIEVGFRKEAAVLQAEALLHSALADYTFDAIDRVMRMVPFEEDIRHLRDPAKLQAFLDDADSIRDDLELFSRGLAAEGAMQHAGLVRTYLDGVLDEFLRARQMNHLRVGRVVELGKILEEYVGSDQVGSEFGPAIHALRSHVRSLLDLTRRHFAATLTRMAPLRDLSSGPDDNQWDLLQDIQRGIKAMVSPGGGLPPLAREDQAVLLSMAESIERLLRQNDVVSTPQARSSLRREVDYRLALLTVSVGLYVEKADAEGHGPGKVLDWIATQYKRAAGVAGLWDLIKSRWPHY